MKPTDSRNIPGYFLLFGAFTLLAMIFTCWYSHGYIHPDEHVQIIEFAASKVGLRAPETLPWEYHRQIRAWFQPFFVVLLEQLRGFLGVPIPISGFVFRLGHALFHWLALCFFCWQLRYTTQGRLLFFARLFTFLFCMVPHLAARTSSENFSTSWLLLALGFLIKRPSGDLRGKEIFFTGILLGLAFEARFQMGFAIVGMALWWLRYAAANLKENALMLTGLALSLFSGIVMDFYGYGNWTFAPWNYFEWNILRGVAADFGVSPWWEYAWWARSQLGPMLGFTLLIVWLTALARLPRSVLTWTLWAFVLGHLVVGHKENRFLYPVYVITPALAGLMLRDAWPAKKLWRFLLIIFSAGLAVSNASWFIYYSLHSPTTELAAWDWLNRTQSKDLCVLWDNVPPETLDKVHYFFIGTAKPVVLPYWDYNHAKAQCPGKDMLVFVDEDTPDHHALLNQRCEIVHRFPQWLNMPYHQQIFAIGGNGKYKKQRRIAAALCK